MSTTTLTTPLETTELATTALGNVTRPWRVPTIVPAIAVVLLSLVCTFRVLPDTRFHPDESRWINRAYYVKELAHPLSIVWEDRYLIRGQPPVGSYVTGLGLLLQGRDLTTNGPWDFRYGNDDTITWNVTRGNMPAWGDLVAARRTSAFFAAVATLAIFLIVTEITNWFGGVAAGVFFAIHPLTVYLGTLATSDSLFTALVALSTLTAIWFARKPGWLRAAALGLLLGLGGGTKLSPLFVAIGLGAYGASLLIAAAAMRFGWIERLLAWIPGLGTTWSRRAGWMLLATPILALALFVVSYPYLWPDPVGRTGAIFDFRRDEMEAQANIWPQTAIDSRPAALSRIWRNLENDYSSSGKVKAWIGHRMGRDTRSRGIDLPVALAGLAVLCLLAFRRGVVSPTMLATLVLAGQAATLIGGLRVDFNRYYLPLVFVCAVGIGVLAGVLWSAAVWLWRRLAHPRRVHEPVPLPAVAAGG